MNSFIIRRMQEDNLQALARNKAFKFTETFFPYTSGEIGPYYVNSEAVMRTPEDFDLAIKSIADLVNYTMKNHLEYIVSGGESRDWVFSNAVAKAIRKPVAMIYKDKKIIPFSNEEIKGKRFVHVADLNNEGSSPRDIWVPAIRNLGGIIENFVSYVDRLEEGVSVLEKLGLQRYAVVPLDENAWNYGFEIQIPGLTQETYKNLKERGKTKQERNFWAEKMLRSEKGLETLANLLINPKTKEKALKILNKGYPELYMELFEKLRKFKGLEFFGFPAEDSR